MYLLENTSSLPGDAASEAVEESVLIEFTTKKTAVIVSRLAASEEDIRRKTEALGNMLAEIKDRGFIRSGELVDIANIARAALKERDAEAQSAPDKKEGK